MNRLIIAGAIVALAASGSAAFADSPVKEADAAKIKAALTEIGCEGGKYEQETEGTGVFEIDDAKCKDGQFDVKLDKDFKITSKTAD